MTDILAPLNQINVVRVVTAQVESFAQNAADIDTNFTAVRVAINALCDRVVALESQAAGSPVLTNFHTTVPVQVTAGTSLSGNSYNATYDIFASTLVTAARLVGFQALPVQGAVEVIVADALRNEGSNTQPFTFPATADLSTNGNAYTFRLELYAAGQTPGTDTPAQSAEQQIIVQSALRSDVLYWGISADNTPGAVDVSTLQSQTRLDGDVTLPTWATDDQYVIFAYPDTAPAVSNLSFNGSFNQLPGFVATTNAITVDGVTYTTLISEFTQQGSVLSGATATITR